MILKGDCIKVMGAIKSNVIDAVICDPPYGLEFMGKEWDRLSGYFGDKDSFEYGGFSLPRQRKRNVKCPDCSHYVYSGTPCKCGGTKRLQAYQMQFWHTQWLTEAYRVLKPGGSMLVMGGTRTFHRLMVAIEDTGFIIKDTLMYVYGSGFPKAQDLGKMIDKRMGAEREKVGERFVSNCAKAHKDGYSRIGGKDGYDSGKAISGNIDITIPSTDLAKHWDGFKIGGIKPAYEPIVWCLKPPEGSYIDNVLKWGVGAVNVDECRVSLNGENPPSGSAKRVYKSNQYTEDKIYGDNKTTPNKGRFPANIILDEEAGRVMDEQSSPNMHGAGKTRKAIRGSKKTGLFSMANNSQRFGDSGGASRFFYCAKASRGERNRGLDGMEEKAGQAYRSIRKNRGKGYPEATQIKNNHPTVKPIALFEWLIKLVTREGQIVLDPFLGSGTTAIAAHKVGRECVGIEREDDYVEIAKRRIEHWEQQPQQQELRA